MLRRLVQSWHYPEAAHDSTGVTRNVATTVRWFFNAPRAVIALSSDELDRLVKFAANRSYLRRHPVRLLLHQQISTRRSNKRLPRVARMAINATKTPEPPKPVRRPAATTATAQQLWRATWR